MFGIFIALFWFCVIHLCTLKISKSNIKNKTLFRIIIYVVVGLLWTMSSPIISRNINGIFSSPETAIKYTSFISVDEVVYGENTALALWREDSTAYSNAIVEKINNKWKVANEDSVDIIYHGVTDEYDYVVYKHMESEEHYIRVFSHSGKELNVSDNRSSEFLKIKCEAEISQISNFLINILVRDDVDLDDLNTTFYYYYGFVGVIDENYILYINEDICIPITDNQQSL